MTYRLLAPVLLVAGIASCAAQTRYAGIPVSQLSDEQLIEEVVSAAEGLGMAVDQTMFLMAVRPEPAYVLTSSTTTFSGVVNASYSAYAMPVGYRESARGQISGSVSGSAVTQYQYTDARAAERLGNAIALAIGQARQEAFRRRGSEVIAEYDARVAARREETERVISEFFASHPQLQNRKMLVAAIAPWVAASGVHDPVATLVRSGEIVATLRRGEGLSGEWYGMFAQTSTIEGGETIAFSQFVQVELAQLPDGTVTGTGQLGTGEQIELSGRLDGPSLSAAVANTTSGINVALSAVAAASQLTGEFEGFGLGQRITGTVVLLR